MKWLLTNKEWVFSGIGVMVIGLLTRLFFGARAAGHSGIVSAKQNSSVLGSPVATGSNISQIVNVVTTSNTPAHPTRIAYSDNPTPEDIRTQLDSLPVFQQKTAINSYVGLKVSWLVRFSSLFELGEAYQRLYKTSETHRIFSRYGREPITIMADVDIERFPRLKIAHRGTPLLILGTIVEVTTTGNVTLKDVEIEFE
jgi:hypothetical protein